mmetsp:Transcript_108951/g.339531  ORF Transcript_108951/g.339531 Transcript_108951/m.339531 type:complete len:209 (+) Transcript_108951:339-965(+)
MPSNRGSVHQAGSRGLQPRRPWGRPRSARGTPTLRRSRTPHGPRSARSARRPRRSPSRRCAGRPPRRAGTMAKRGRRWRPRGRAPWWTWPTRPAGGRGPRSRRRWQTPRPWRRGCRRRCSRRRDCSRSPSSGPGRSERRRAAWHRPRGCPLGAQWPVCQPRAPAAHLEPQSPHLTQQLLGLPARLGGLGGTAPRAVLLGAAAPINVYR